MVQVVECLLGTGTYVSNWHSFELLHHSPSRSEQDGDREVVSLIQSVAGSGGRITTESGVSQQPWISSLATLMPYKYRHPSAGVGFGTGIAIVVVTGFVW